MTRLVGPVLAAAAVALPTPAPTPAPSPPASAGGGCLGGLSDLFGCLLDPITAAVGQAVAGVWTDIARSFAQGAADLLGGFAGFFVHATTISLGSAGVRTTFVLCAGIAAAVAVVVLAGQVGSSVLRRDGAGVGRALVGAGQAWVLLSSLLVVVSTLLAAADQLTARIVGDPATYTALQARLTTVFTAGATAVGPALLLIFGLVGIGLSIVLYLEMLVRQAAIVVLVATAPIAVAGLLGDRTRVWCTKTATMIATLVFLKPVIAVIFAVGINAVSTATGVNGMLSALAILTVAAIAWPVLARLLSFTSVGGGAGALAGVALGALAAKAGSRGPSSSSSGGSGGGGGGVAAEGPAPAASGEGRTAGGALAGRGMGVGGGSAAGPGGAAAGGPSAGSGGPGAGAGAAAGGVAAGVGMLVSAAARAALATAAAVDRTAEHGGADGALTHGSPFTGSGGSPAGYAAPNHRPAAGPPNTATAATGPSGAGDPAPTGGGSSP